MDWPSLPWTLLLVVLAVALVAIWGHYLFWTWRLGVQPEYAELHRVPTPDGSAIELRRLPPPETPELPPVLLVHGVAASHRNHDVDPDHSLARHLHDAGHDVWLVTLRSGRSDLGRTEAREVRFESMVEHDLPVAVAQIRERTRSEQVDFVGFSMGGMLLYAALDRTLDSSLLRRVVIIGSPAVVVPPWRWLRFFRRFPAWLLPSLWLRLGARFVAFAADWVPTPLHGVIYNRENVDRGAIPTAMVNALADIPGTLSRDFAAWALGDGHIRIGGERVLARLEGVTVPAAFFAGAADRIAPPDAVRAAYERWGSAREGVHKEWHLLAASEGCQGDYGHGDMVVGRGVQKDLFAPVAGFLGPSGGLHGTKEAQT